MHSFSYQQPPFGLDARNLLIKALEEDSGDGDHTSLSTIAPDQQGTGIVRVKQSGIIAGIEVAENVAALVDSALTTNVLINDGAAVEPGDIVMEINGKVRSLLQAERLLLNCMQRMSGIATLTRHFTKAVEGTGCRILDTRKTTPNFRYFEKWAVRLGGGMNHRYGLFDMILIKDNHVDAAGSIAEAIRRANSYLNSTGRHLAIEIETRSMDEVRQAVDTGGIQRIMLDNFSPELLREAVRFISKRFETEASGGIRLENVWEYAQTGVDFISVGALTHSYESLDISMKIVRS